jgi:hypothetical protein
MSGFTYILLGLATIISSQITGLTSWIVGSQIFQGNIFFDTTNNAAPSIMTNTIANATYPKVIPFVASGHTALIASLAMPQAYSSGALIVSYSVECGGVQIATSGSLVVQSGLKQDKGTGLVLRTGVSVSTGSVTGMSTGTVVASKIQKSYLLNFITTASGSKNSGVIADCVAHPFLREKYGR